MYNQEALEYVQHIMDALDAEAFIPSEDTRTSWVWIAEIRGDSADILGLFRIPDT